MNQNNPKSPDGQTPTWKVTFTDSITTTVTAPTFQQAIDDARRKVERLNPSPLARVTVHQLNHKE